MDHVVYLDAQAKELENLFCGSKTMILRGATGRKLPHGHVDAGNMDDWLPVEKIESVAIT